MSASLPLIVRVSPAVRPNPSVSQLPVRTMEYRPLTLRNVTGRVTAFTSRLSVMVVFRATFSFSAVAGSSGGAYESPTLATR